MLRRTQTLLLCHICAILLFSPMSHAWDLVQASSQQGHGPGLKPGGNKMIRDQPDAHGHSETGMPGHNGGAGQLGHGSGCSLPEHRTGGWELAGDVFFARMKGKVRFFSGNFGTFFGLDDVDLNADMGLDDHGVMPSFMAMYKFRPKWAFRYSIMPMSMMGSGQAGRSFVFGNTLYTAGQPVSIEWQHLEQRFGLIYDAFHAHSSRISVFGDYVRVNDRIKAMQMQMGMGGDIMDVDLNMGMAGVEWEKCLKTTYNKATLSLECLAGAAFLDDAVGMEADTALKYSISMNNGRWGFVKGGYRYLTYKQKSSDARLFDYAMEGGFLQMGLIF